MPKEFPIDNLSADVYPTESGILTAVVVGNTQEGLENDTTTLVWSTENGMTWYPLEATFNNNCPKLTDPSIIRYNKAFYICGKDAKDNKGFEKFYVSPTLLSWKGVDNMFMLPGILAPIVGEGFITYPKSPYTFYGKTANYSMVVDKNHFIWMVGDNNIGSNNSSIGKIWRGRVNKLGFLIQ